MKPGRSPAARRPQRHPAIEQIIRRTLRAYTASRATYLRAWGSRRYREPRLLRDCLARLPAGAAILDLGCGPGQDARYIMKLRRDGARLRVVALDLCWPLLRYARRRSPALPLVQADLRRLPLAPETFDGVWAAASLMHLPKSQVPGVLRALRGRVKPGGLLGATLAHGGTSGYVRRGWIPGRFIARWRKAELARAVGRAGWHVLRLETVTGRERKGRWLNLLARRPCP